MKRLMSLLLAAVLVLSLPLALAEETAEATESPDLTDAIFLVEDMLYDDDGSVLCIEGEYAYIGMEPEEEYETLMPYGVDATYALAEGCTFSMPLDMGDEDIFENHEVEDLGAWYNEVILQGLELDDESEFYSFTVQLTLNEDDEVTHVEYVYTPWA